MKTNIYIPENSTIEEKGYFLPNDICNLLRKYKSSPEKVEFLADMLEV